MTLPEKPDDLTDEERILLILWIMDINTTIIPKPTIKPDEDT